MHTDWCVNNVQAAGNRQRPLESKGLFGHLFLWMLIAADTISPMEFIYISSISSVIIHDSGHVGKVCTFITSHMNFKQLSTFCKWYILHCNKPLEKLSLQSALETGFTRILLMPSEKMFVLFRKKCQYKLWCYSQLQKWCGTVHWCATFYPVNLWNRWMEVYKIKFPLLKGRFTHAIFDCDFLLLTYVSINYDANEYFQHKCTEPSQMISTCENNELDHIRQKSPV